MDGHAKKSLSMFTCSLLLTLVGILLTATPAWLAGVPMLYAATFCAWQGFISRSRMVRARREGPCCLEYRETGFQHDEVRCTRYRNRKPQPKSPEERAEIDRVWSEMISHLQDPEYGEET